MTSGKKLRLPPVFEPGGQHFIALMKKHLPILVRQSFAKLPAALAALMLCGFVINGAHAQSLPPGVQDVLKLTQAGIAEDIILNQIKNNAATYRLTADQIILLKNQGVSQPVIKALLAGADTPPASMAPVPPPAIQPPAPVPTPAAPPLPGLNDYQTQLAPYGTWLPVPDYGLCWQPAIAATDPFWRPYLNQGHWIYTAAGWSWQSDYAWGATVFHYGRWLRFQSRWVWVPGQDFAPAWVCWREANGYCGWAPLPPAARYTAGVGLFFNGHLAIDADFGLGLDAFNFVAYDHFWNEDLHPYLLPQERLEAVFRESRIANGYRMDHGRFVVEGLGHDRIEILTHHSAKAVAEHHDARVPGRGNYDEHQGRSDKRDQHGW